VRDVGVEAADGTVRFHVRLRGEATVELTAAMKRAKYFRKVYETDVDIESSAA
jgi:hypothetical protein